MGTGVHAVGQRLFRLTSEYLASRPKETPVSRVRLEPSLTDFTHSGWSYYPLKDLNSSALLLNRALGDMRFSAMPEAVSMDVIGFCNLRCPHCPSHGSEAAHAKFQSKVWTMSDDAIRSIAHGGFPYARTVSFSGTGENMLSSNLTLAATLAHAHGCNMFINTNGTIIAKKRLRPLWGATHLCISLDGATPASFEALRRGADFSKVMRNVRVVTRAGEFLPISLRLRPSINFGICADNLRDMPLMVALAQFLRVRRISGLLIDTGVPLVNEQHPGAYRYHHDCAAEAARTDGVALQLPPPLPDALPDPEARPCNEPRLVPPLPDSYYRQLPRYEDLVDLTGLDEEAMELAIDALEAGLERMSGPLNEANGEASRRAEGLRQELLARMSETYERLTPAEHARMSRLKGSSELTPYCEFLYRYLYVDAKGDARPCCDIRLPSMGNLASGSVEEIFNGPALRELSQAFSADNPHPGCAVCVKWTRVAERYLLPVDVIDRASDDGLPGAGLEELSDRP